MKFSKYLAEKDDGTLWAGKGPQEPLRQVLPVSQVCRRLKRSRRQIYRNLEEGTLSGAMKLGGIWWIDADQVEQLRRRPLTRQPVAARLQWLFPEYQVSRLNAGRDQVLILARILEQGGLPELRWAIRRYPRILIRNFLVEEGARLLSPRTLRLWSIYFRINPKAGAKWRSQPSWGGIQS